MLISEMCNVFVVSVSFAVVFFFFFTEVDVVGNVDRVRMRRFLSSG